MRQSGLGGTRVGDRERPIKCDVADGDLRSGRGQRESNLGHGFQAHDGGQDGRAADNVVVEIEVAAATKRRLDHQLDARKVNFWFVHKPEHGKLADPERQVGRRAKSAGNRDCSNRALGDQLAEYLERIVHRNRVYALRAETLDRA